MRPTTGALPLLLLLAAGCGGAGGAPLAPRYDAAELAKAVLDAHDRNRDGTLEPGEVESSPALKAAFASIDANKDRRLSEEELRQRFSAYGAAAAGGRAVVVACQVFLNGRPVAGATVRLIPDRAFADILAPATGTTDRHGLADLRSEAPKAPGIYPGLYWITVSKLEAGKDLPARYNAQTTLGRELFEARGSTVNIELRLTR